MAALVAALPAIAETGAQILASMGVSKLFEKATDWFNNRNLSNSLDAVKHGAKALAHKFQTEVGQAKQSITDNDFLRRVFNAGQPGRASTDYRPSANYQTEYSPIVLPAQQRPYAPVSSSQIAENAYRGPEFGRMVRPSVRGDIYSSDSSRTWGSGLSSGRKSQSGSHVRIARPDIGAGVFPTGSPGNNSSEFGNTSGGRYVEQQVPKIVPTRKLFGSSQGGTIPPGPSAKKLFDYGGSQFGFSTGTRYVEPQAPFASIRPGLPQGDVFGRPSSKSIATLDRELSSIDRRFKKVLGDEVAEAKAVEAKVEDFKKKARANRAKLEDDEAKRNYKIAKAKIQALKEKADSGKLTADDKRKMTKVKKIAR